MQMTPRLDSRIAKGGDKTITPSNMDSLANRTHAIS